MNAIFIGWTEFHVYIPESVWTLLELCYNAMVNTSSRTPPFQNDAHHNNHQNIIKKTRSETNVNTIPIKWKKNTCNFIKQLAEHLIFASTRKYWYWSPSSVVIITNVFILTREGTYYTLTLLFCHFNRLPNRVVYMMYPIRFGSKVHKHFFLQLFIVILLWKKV